MNFKERIKAAISSGEEVELIPVTTNFSRNVYIGIAQYAHDKGMPYDQDAIRILVANALALEGYPKEVHKIKK